MNPTTHPQNYRRLEVGERCNPGDLVESKGVYSEAMGGYMITPTILPRWRKKENHLNIGLLRRVQYHIREEPLRLEMMNWLKEAEGPISPSCGTVGCIAGWTVKLGGSHKERGNNVEISYEAAELLGLQWEIRWEANMLDRHSQAAKLFYPHYWPEPFQRLHVTIRDALVDCDTVLARRAMKTVEAELVCARIDHLIETGL